MADDKHVTHEALTNLLGQAISDKDFRAHVLKDPKAALTAKGFAPNDAAVKFFQSLHSDGFDAAAKKVKVKGKTDPIEVAGDN